MSSKLQRASGIAVAATLITAAFSADGSGAAARDIASAAAIIGPASQFIAQPVVQQLPAREDGESVATDTADNAPAAASTLPELVAAQPVSADLSRELHCLAGAVYFEAKSESLEGQLAVGRVIVARSKSGRFPGSYCGVVFQQSQFSFVRGNAIPNVDQHSRQWRNAVAIAQIAHAGSWRSPVEGALFFHATHVSPGWNLTRMARVDHHVFYR